MSSAIGIRKGMEKMQRAFEIYPYCAMALNYLANHFFFTGQHFLVEQLTETALAVSNQGPMKSHSFYNLARSYHSKVGKSRFSFFYFCVVYVPYMCLSTRAQLCIPIFIIVINIIIVKYFIMYITPSLSL